MKNLLKIQSLIFALTAMMAIVSCSKSSDVKLPPLTDENALDNSLKAGENTVMQPLFGLYRVAKFIDTGDDETSQFNGYTFEFQADGDLIATTNTGAVHNGSWALNSARTMAEITISGTAALDDLDDDNWNVATLTNLRVVLTAPGPDRVVFVKI